MTYLTSVKVINGTRKAFTDHLLLCIDCTYLRCLRLN